LFLFQAAGVPVDFETFFFSEVHHTMSAPLEDVAKSIATNRICLKVKEQEKYHSASLIVILSLM
jgi:isocitrate dehydrogenase (NAD+)